MTDRQDLNADPVSVATRVAPALQARGVARILGLQGGHIQPIRDYAARLGIRIVDLRDEGAAVLMAHAHADLTGGPGGAIARAFGDLGEPGPRYPEAPTDVLGTHMPDRMTPADRARPKPRRRMAVEPGDPVDAALDALTGALGNDTDARDADWLRGKRRERTASGESTPAPRTGDDGRNHPLAIFEAIRVADPADLAAAIGRVLGKAPVVIDVVTSQQAVSLDAQKGLGFVPDDQALTAWDDAERMRREIA